MANPVYVSMTSKTQRIDSVFPEGHEPAVSYLSKPNERYLWNQYLTDLVRSKIHHDWILNIIHGFVDQANISIYGSPILLTLVARRSNRYAGTRFLKRGANFKVPISRRSDLQLRSLKSQGRSIDLQQRSHESKRRSLQVAGKVYYDLQRRSLDMRQRPIDLSQ
jgi:hypothetical protein